MARLIDADKIVNGISLYMTENAYLNDTPLDELKMVANWITDAPTVDAVEVVRCWECKHRDGIPGQPNIVCSQMHDDDFCSYGGRKDDDGNG